MSDRARRHELREEARQHPPEAGVYAIRNTRTGRVLVASTLNLPGMRNRFEFARTTGTAGAIDGRLAADVREHGIEVLELDVLDVVEVRPDTDPAELRVELAALESLWREKLEGESRV